MSGLIEAESKLSAVTIPEMRSTFFAANLSTGVFPESIDRSEWTIVDDVQLELPRELYRWSDGAEVAEAPILCRSATDFRCYQVFQRSSEIREDAFVRTGTAYGGTYSEWHWGRFAQELPRILDFHRIPDSDPPEAMDEVMHSIREAY